jgi:YEATS domain-containing protein 4
MDNSTTTTPNHIASAPITPRLSRTTACLPIVYGSVAYYLGKKADETATHEWTLYLRGPNHEDLSPAISKVIFQLHPSFAQPMREYTEPPYQVTEKGWGEFESLIHIHWKDPTEKKTILNHTIKLYPPGTPPNVMPTDTETPVLAEMYDEVVFTDPTDAFFRSLTLIPSLPKLEPDKEDEDGNKKPKKKDGDEGKDHHLNIVYSDQQDFMTLIAAQKFLQEELAKVKERFQDVNNQLVDVDHKLIAMQQQKQREAASTTGVRASPAASATAGTVTAVKPTSSGKKIKAPGKARPGQAKRPKTGSSPVPLKTGAAAPGSVGKTIPRK